MAPRYLLLCGAVVCGSVQAHPLWTAGRRQGGSMQQVGPQVELFSSTVLMQGVRDY